MLDSRSSASSPFRAIAARTLPIVAVALLAACGGGGGGSPTAPPGPQTAEFTGTAQVSANGTCSSSSHGFLAAEGAISVTLLSTTGNVGMAVQVCANGIDNNDCSIQLTPIAVGQTVTGTRRGGSVQGLAVNPASCGGGGPAPPGPVQYAVRVVFQL